MRTLIIVWALCCLSCRSAPPLSIETEFGIVRAHTTEALAQFEAALQECSPKVQSLLGTSSDDHAEVWILSTQRLPDGPWGVFANGRIEIGLEAMQYPNFAMAHELSHSYRDKDSAFTSLPWFIEEGLADWISCEVTSNHPLRGKKLKQLGKISIPISVAECSVWEWMELPDETQSTAALIGYALVQDLGIDRIKEMARNNAPPLDYIHASKIGNVRLD